jgi:hypothetical protein
MVLSGTATKTPGILHHYFECVSRRQLWIGNDWRGLLAEDYRDQKQQESDANKSRACFSRRIGVGAFSVRL